MADMDLDIKIRNGLPSLSILEFQEVFDAQGNSLGASNKHRSAMGRGDYNSDAEFIAALDSKLTEKLGAPVATGLAELKTVIDNLAELTNERDNLILQRDNLQAQRDTLQTERDSLQTQNENLTNQNQAIATERAAAIAERDALQDLIRGNNP